MNVIWSSSALAQVLFWELHNPKIKKRIHALIDDIRRSPYTGIGKPEALKHELSGSWSRRIDQEHRLVYALNSATKTIEIKSCKGHYTECQK